jgi:hypothetical protein
MGARHTTTKEGQMASKENTRTCGCGCGKPVTRTYLPGHDAKHKSALIATVLGSSDPAAVKAAKKVLRERNWTPFLTRKQEILAAKAKRAK